MDGSLRQSWIKKRCKILVTLNIIVKIFEFGFNIVALVLCRVYTCRFYNQVPNEKLV